jgi:succinate dehydrogenase / fumarate reductase cytochrome b subunit
VRVFAAHPQVTVWSTVVGKKVVMAMTGTVLVGFIIGHILGNLQIFMG